MAEQPENPPAFPRNSKLRVDGSEPGMTLRDWFAGQALVGYNVNRNDVMSSPKIAHFCYEDADAMLAERERKLTDG